MSVYTFVLHFPKVRGIELIRHVVKLLISNKFLGLFHRAISQSGHPLKEVMSKGSARKLSWITANLMGCKNIKRSEELLKCLQKVPVDILIKNLQKDEVSTVNNFTSKKLLSRETWNTTFICSVPQFLHQNFIPLSSLETQK